MSKSKITCITLLESYREDLDELKVSYSLVSRAEVVRYLINKAKYELQEQKQEESEQLPFFEASKRLSNEEFIEKYRLTSMRKQDLIKVLKDKTGLSLIDIKVKGFPTTKDGIARAIITARKLESSNND